ncbi:hypothetical protein SAMN02746066_02704 [Anaerosporobacter mobilis DSM 15930]|uniref:Restriction endonuclease n=1 Tax=Anaerosporobacter mobilis DSM 15930 TaxID=1120996 RepID=A0A1M7KEB9_9FIRM|nr:hypothetical protein [Anaerosporobacter mobilis]SHM63617.1 hypothetical protein SAMN02746066_02704 [Anaerosporobacter mobilis DSM 15930]
MDKSFDMYKKFEEICIKILKHHFCEIETNKLFTINDKRIEIDAIITNSDQQKTIVEIKMYRNFSVNLNLIEKALEKVRRNSLDINIPNSVLLISAKLDEFYKVSYEIDFGVNIIDIENILFLSNSIPEVKKELIEVLGLKSDNENDIKGNPCDINKIFNYQSNVNNTKGKITLDENNKGEILYSELLRIKPGKRAFAEYENKCTEILKYLFDNSLDGWHKQNRTDDGLHRFDLICRIKSEDGIWSIFINDFKSRYLLFEFKNYSEKISQNQIYTTEKYLFAKALRNVAIIISRSGASNNALKASDGIIKESGKIILNINDLIIYEMIKMKDSGSDPTDFLFDLLDERLLQLSK